MELAVKFTPTMRLLLALIAFPMLAAAAPPCPAIDGKYLDVNCDGKLTIMGLGDSLTTGVADLYSTTIKGQLVNFVNSGGYPARLLKYFENSDAVKVIQLSFPGQSCKEIWVKFRLDLQKKKPKSKFADVAFLLCGINDYEDTPEPKYSRDYIVKMQRLAKRNAIKLYLGDLLPVMTKENVIEWRNGMNSILAPIVNVPFRFMPEALLGEDGLHPLPEGYDFMFDLVRNEIEETFGTEAQHGPIFNSLGLGADRDSDGLPDKIEKKFRTDPDLPDSDGDSVTDLEEILAGTSPLKPNV